MSVTTPARADSNMLLASLQSCQMDGQTSEEPRSRTYSLTLSRHTPHTECPAQTGTGLMLPPRETEQFTDGANDEMSDKTNKITKIMLNSKHS